MNKSKASQTSYRHSTHIALGLVIVLYSIAAIARIPTNSAFYDAAQVLYLVKHSIAAGVLPLHGIINSQNLYNPPFFVWYYYIPALFTADPGIIFVIPNLAAQIATMLLLYVIGRDYFLPTTGLVAATLYVFSPLGIEFGRMGWAYAQTAPIYVAIIFCLFRWLISRQSIYIIPLIILCGWSFGVHLAGALTFFVVGGAALAWRTLPPLRPTLIGIGLLVLLWAPFFVFQASRGFADIAGLVQPPLILPGELSPLCPPDWNSLLPNATHTKNVTLDRIAASIYNSTFINHRPTEIGRPMELVITYDHIVLVGLSVLLALAGSYLVYRIVRRIATPAEQLLFLVLVAPIVLQSLTPFNAVERPDITWTWLGVQALAVGYLLTAPTVMQSRFMIIAVLIGLAVMMGYESYQTGHILQAWARGDLYDGRQEVADVIAADAAERGVQHVAIRYDVLQEDPSLCWVVGMSTIIDTGYIGAEFDYYLRYMHNMQNTAQPPDGWVETPDYIVTKAISPRVAYYTAHPERYTVLGARPPFQVWYYQR
ncbi:MAG: glycosyltransferase family 39 protein [Chloroflexaceae bacterium]|nr:glycosyltransferase family 39 protein [Chloroflexaceae bacterium]